MHKTTLKEVNRFLLCGVLICAVLYYAQVVLIPLAFSIFFAMLFTPLSNRMECKGVSRVFSAIISLLIVMLITVGITILVYMQAKKMVDQFPVIEKKAQTLVQQGKAFMSEKLHIPAGKQDSLADKQVKKIVASSGNFITTFVSGMVSVLGGIVLVLIFTFLFLFQRDKYEAFFLQLYNDSTPDDTRKIIHKISTVAQSYLTGRALSIVIFTVLFTIGFLAVGLEGAFLLAFVSALLTIVPYVGSIVGGMLPFAIALVTADTSAAMGALAVVVFVQGVDNYFIEPYIIGGEVHINAFFTILILFIGGLLWGVAGMILFLPMLGVTKIIFDNVPALKPYAFLIGDQEVKKNSEVMMNFFKKLFKRNKS
jgi:predicted PurR-regulated permease PerM